MAQHARGRGAGASLAAPCCCCFPPATRRLPRPGRLRLVNATGELDPQAVASLPPIAAYGQDGLLYLLTDSAAGRIVRLEAAP